MFPRVLDRDESEALVLSPIMKVTQTVTDHKRVLTNEGADYNIVWYELFKILLTYISHKLTGQACFVVRTPLFSSCQKYKLYITFK